MSKNSKLFIFLKGLILENPVLVLVLGTCPTLAQTTSVINALGMGVAATLVLVCSNMVISALRKVASSFSICAEKKTVMYGVTALTIQYKVKIGKNLGDTLWSSLIPRKCEATAWRIFVFSFILRTPFLLDNNDFVLQRDLRILRLKPRGFRAFLPL